MKGSKALGELLRICRGDMSQQELADQLFIDRSLVSKVETGSFTPDEDLVNRWIEVTYDRWILMRSIQASFRQMREIVEQVGV